MTGFMTPLQEIATVGLLFTMATGWCAILLIGATKVVR
jgi:hypothetical protein